VQTPRRRRASRARITATTNAPNLLSPSWTNATFLNFVNIGIVCISARPIHDFPTSFCCTHFLLGVVELFVQPLDPGWDAYPIGE